MESGDLEDAERRVILPQDAVDLFGMPRWIAQLEGVAMARRQDFEERLQPLRVDIPAGRKLEDDRPQFPAQPVHVLKEFADPGFGVFQLLHVSQKPAALHRKAEARGR